ncbi:hypothetical protein NVP1161O_007 [Vibrio phage 1.161.O._10N.261.48.C5]|nr:hypothetical protein NVP1161O_007 [Vibrio phage 1.161.O._10N.261.48.C5]
MEEILPSRGVKLEVGGVVATLDSLVEVTGVCPFRNLTEDNKVFLKELGYRNLV